MGGTCVWSGRVRWIIWCTTTKLQDVEIECVVEGVIGVMTGGGRTAKCDRVFFVLVHCLVCSGCKRWVCVCVFD